MVSDYSQTRVYEKLRFDRVRQSQLSGEDLRNRWHNALKLLRDGEQLDPDDIKIKVGINGFLLIRLSSDELLRIGGCTPSMPKQIPEIDGMK